MMPIRLLVAADHTIVRQGLVSMLEETGECQVVAQAADGFEAFLLAEKTQPDVVVTDISMPRMSGLEVVKRVRAELLGTRTLVLTVHAEAEYTLPILATAVNGLLNKDITSTELVTATEWTHVRYGTRV